MYFDSLNYIRFHMNLICINEYQNSDLKFCTSVVTKSKKNESSLDYLQYVESIIIKLQNK